MDNALANLDLKTLRDMYEKESGVLRTALINGSSWEEMREQRLRVTEISIAMHRKRQGGGHPAGNDHRPS
jgi:hypothetical protein